MDPTRQSIVRAIRQFKLEGIDKFLERYARGRRPKAYFIKYKDELFPMKAIWAASHNPTILNRDFHQSAAKRGFYRLGFEEIVSGDAAKQFLEGEMRRSETSSFARNPKLVAAAKVEYGLKCQACKFDFEAFYGSIGKNYIECHHIIPIAERGGRTEPRTLDDVTVLCSNCHRMVHHDRGREVLHLDELRAAIAKSQRAS